MSLSHTPFHTPDVTNLHCYPHSDTHPSKQGQGLPKSHTPFDADHELCEALYRHREGNHHRGAWELEEGEAVEDGGDREGGVAQGPVTK